MMQRFRPSADIQLKENEMIARFNLPGIEKENIDVDIVNSNLEVRVEKLSERREGKENAYVMERSFSAYFQSIPLPSNADLDNVNADYDGETLVVTIPLLAEGQTREARGTTQVSSAGTGRARGGEVARPGGTGSLTTGVSPSEAPAPHQERLPREEMMRQGTFSPLYRSGSGSYYSETFEKPTGDTAPQAYFGGGTEESLARRERAVVQREAEVARRESEVSRRERVGQPGFTGSLTTGSVIPEAPSPEQKQLSREEMLRQGTFSPLYRSGSGSYYSGTFEKPSGDTAPEAYFGEGSSHRVPAPSRGERRKVNVK